MSTATTIPTCTIFQRQHIRKLCALLEIPTRTVTLMHLPFFLEARIAWINGADLEVSLSGISKAAAGRLIEALQERAYGK